MRKRAGGVSALLLALGVMFGAHAELQNVTVGGKIEIYGASYSSFFVPEGSRPAIGLWPLNGRPLGGDGAASAILADRGKGASLSFAEQRTRLHVTADFTEEVTAFFEIDSIETWGEDFRSAYLTGADVRATTGDDVELFQSYVDLKAIGGSPLSLRVGRQELEFGSGWLVGADPGPDPFCGLSFDAVRLTYAGESFTADAWWGRMAETLRGFGQGDTDFYGLYLSCGAVEDMTFDVYWMYLRDEIPVDLGLSPIARAMSALGGLDDFGVTQLHTVGLRWSGTAARWDWEAEAAYQWGKSGLLGATFRPWPGFVGDEDARYSNFAGHGVVGYTFESQWSPRVAVGGAYYGGEDHRDISFGQWLSPFDQPRSSVSFNRLFSAMREDDLLDGNALSNFWKAYATVSVNPAEKLTVEMHVRYLQAVAPFERPNFFLFPWSTHEGSKDLGWQWAICATYSYSDDLSFDAGYTHYFVGDALKDGVFIDGNGTTFDGGFDDDDVDYFFAMMTLEF